MTVKIRREIKEDTKAVFEINTLAFGQDSEARLVEMLRVSDAFVPELSLVATLDHKIVGHILFTKIIITDENQSAVESLALAPMAVIPEYQKKGIGGELIKSGLAKAKELGYRSVIVLGHEKYYPKFGFVPASRWNIKAPFDVPANAFMGIELIAEGLTGVYGTVKYPEAFEAV